MNSDFSIGSFSLGAPFRPYIIAEIGVNHEGSLATAKKLIDEAREAGAHAAKFQTYKADKIAVADSPAYWDLSQEPTTTQHELFKKYDSFNQGDFEELASYCNQVGIDFMSTPFDLDAVDFLAPLVPAFKIASADITNIPLVRKCAAYAKPLILSTGASTLAEIEHATEEAVRAGASAIALLHCVLNYPTPESHAQLGVIRVLQRSFPQFAIGYSDHVVPDENMSCLQLATMLGSKIIEKHFTNDRTLPGNDHYHAMDKRNLRAYLQAMDEFRNLYGNEIKTVEHERSAITHARRSIVSSMRICAGDKFTEQNLIAKRPGHGISPIHWDELLGCVAAEDIEADQIISWHQVRPANPITR